MASERVDIIFQAHDNATRTANQVGNSMSRLESTIGKLGIAVGATGLALTIANLGKSMISAASNAEETANKFNATFGASAKLAREELEEFADVVGRGNQELVTMASDVGAVLKSAGLLERQAANLSVDLTKLATDVASFTNANDADVLRAFSRALTGEREALKTYGISILEAEVQQKALEMGFERINGQLSSSDKAMATYQLLLEKTKDSQGDAAKTADSYANQVRKLQGNIDDLQAALGRRLLPTANDTISTFAHLVSITEELNKKAGGEGEERGLLALISPNTDRTLRRMAADIERFDEWLQKSNRSAKEVVQAVKEIQAGTGEIANLSEAGTGNIAKNVKRISDSIVDAKQANEDFALSWLTTEANAKSFAEQYKKTIQKQIELADKQREEAEKQRKSEEEKKFEFIRQRQALFLLNYEIEQTIEGNERQEFIGRQVARVNKLVTNGQMEQADALKVLRALLKSVQQEYDRTAESAVRALQAQRKLAAEVSGGRIDFQLPVTEEFLRSSGISTIFNQLVKSVGASNLSKDGLPTNLDDFISFMIDAVESAMSRTGGTRGEALIEVLRNMRGVFDFHQGGIVPGPMGAAVPAIVHGGERVIPNGAQAGFSVNIYNPTIFGQIELEELIVNAVRDHTLAGGFSDIFATR